MSQLGFVILYTRDVARDQMSAGRLAVPDGPGIGPGPDHEVLARYAATQLRRSASFVGMPGAGGTA